MNIKKFIFILIMSCLTLPIFSRANEQYIFDLNTSKQLINSITCLYIQSNLAFPSMTGPYSVEELKKMLNQVKFNKLDHWGKKEFNRLNSKFNLYINDLNKNVEYDFKPILNIETYTHLNNIDFIERDSWVRDWPYMKNLLDLNLSIISSSNFYALVDFSLSSARVLEVPFGSNFFQTNIIGLTDVSFETDIEANFPHRAFVSFGDSFWNLQVGRDNLKWGAAVSSNLLISDNLKYQDFIKYSTFGNKMKYTYLVSFFPHQLNYIKTVGEDINDSQLDPLKGFSMFVVHKFEGRGLNNKFGWAIAEGLMYASETSTIDFRSFNPMLVYHNIFLKSNCNSILSFDFDYNINNSINVYTQFVLDDLVFVLTENSSSSHAPNAYGLILGIKKYKLVNDNVASLLSVEIAYTSPYLYLRNKGKNDSSSSIQEGYGINFIVATREFGNTNRAGGVLFDKQFLGYKYGGDALVFNLNKRYMFTPSTLIFECNFLSMVHGTFDIDTPWSTVGGSSLKDSGFLSWSNWDQSKKGYSFTNIYGIYSSFDLKSHINIFGQLDMISILNYDHKGNNKADIQLTVGVTSII